MNPVEWTRKTRLIHRDHLYEEAPLIYAKRKTAVKTVFGRIKEIFGVGRLYVWGNQAVETKQGFLFMSMNLTELTKILAGNASKIKKTTSENQYP